MAIPLFQGVGQMTPTQQATMRGALGTARASPTRGRRRKAGGKKKRAAAGAPKKRRAKARKASSKRGGKKRLVKGSPAAKAYMAKIRKMRKR